jgi:MraZ protein
MAGFLGEYEVTLDAKGRFLLPAGLKNQMGENADKRFVIKRGFEECLNLYTWEDWQKISLVISELSSFDDEVREFTRLFLNGATITELDTAGRLLIPPGLKPYAELKKDMMVSANVNTIEIWDKDKYGKLFEGLSKNRLRDMANKFFRK